ncbi:UNVERIFIED_CONTAM: hypothetical protein K2H54_061977 [Gekko kuhli]
MKEQSGALPEEGPEGVRNPLGVAQSEFTGERPSWKARQDIRWDPSKGMHQHWESQWQEFLKTLQSPHSAWGSPLVAETTLWDDAKAFLTSFEQVAQACQWPREEWVVRLLPALSGEAQQAFGTLEARDREDYGKEPLQELIRGSPAEEGAPSDFDQRRVVKETKQNSNRDAGVLGSGMTCPNDSKISLPSKEQETTRAGPTEAPVTLKETSMSMHVVEPALAKPSQRTMFWQVMQEDEGNADSLEGLLVPKSDLASHLEKGDEMFIQFPEESERLPGRDPGLEKRSRIKMEGSRQGEAGPEETQGAAAEISQWNFPATAEIHVPRCDEKRNQFQVEEKFQQGEIGTEETPGMLVETARWNFPTRAEIYKERCGEKRSQIKMENSQQEETRPEKTLRTLAEGTQWSRPGPSEIHKQKGASVGEVGKKPAEGRNGCSETTDALKTAVSESSALCAMAKNPFVPKCGKSDHYNAGNEKRSQIKVENSQQGNSGPEEIYGTLAEITQWNVPGTFEIHKERYVSNWQQERPEENEGSDEKRSQIKVENWQHVELGPEETQWTLAEISPWESPVTAEIYEQRCKYRGDRGTNPAEEEHECSEIAFTPSIIGNSAVSSRAKKPLVSSKACFDKVLWEMEPMPKHCSFSTAII